MDALHGLAGRAVLVVTGLGGLGQEHDENDLTYCGNQAQQQVPGGLAGVVEPAETHGQAGD